VKKYLAVAGLVLLGGLIPACAPSLAVTEATTSVTVPLSYLSLPPVDLKGQVPLETTLAQRRSVRDYGPEALTLEQVSQLLWAGQGITADGSARTAPSAGGLFPLEVFLVAGEVTGLAAGVYRYLPQGHQLEPVGEGDRRTDLGAASLGQAWVEQGKASLVVAAVPGRTTEKYGDRGERYVYLEAGHAAQNICLEATALGLGTVTVGAFDDGAVRRVIGAPADMIPLYVMPVGRIAA
jgi:SagB-type dehydrogenase family enzyme